MTFPLAFLLLHVQASWTAEPCPISSLSPVEALLDAGLADGFDFPVGDENGQGTYISQLDGKTYDGWRVAIGLGARYSVGIHTGEDWNGKGGGHTDRGQPVHAVARGCVRSARDEGPLWGNVVVLVHHYLENHRVLRVDSLYAHLDSVEVQPGQRLQRRQRIGTAGDGHGAFPAHLHLELRREAMADRAVTYWPSADGKNQAWVLEHYESPSPFIKAHRSLPVPVEAQNLLVAVKHDYLMHHFRSGELEATYPIALSQNPLGHKQRRGDNRLPEGAYRVLDRSRGPFGGAVAAYFGPAWMRISYPNDWDAADGLARGLIDQAQHDAILRANARGSEPPKSTALGGGIGIHGWAGDWPAGDRHLTWGCISMRNQDLDRLYERIPSQTPVYVLP